MALCSIFVQLNGLRKNASQNFSRKLNYDISGKASSAWSGKALPAVF